jgi:uncharacterized SAM-binding protein YcdF (DUF218 family)
MIFKIIRNAGGILLILLIVPPISVGVINFFVLLPAFAGIFLILLPVFRKLIHRLGEKTEKHIVRIFTLLLIAASILIAAELGVIWASIPAQEAPDQAVVIVLGAQVVNSKPTLILAGRIKSAADYLSSHPDSVCIASGGQGADENISEAQCIRDSLIIDYGINSNRIYLEDKSFSTSQNLENSANIISKNGLSTNVVIATDGFHMFRAKTLARWKGLVPYSCPASTDKRLVLSLYLREFVGIPKTFLMDR